MKYMLNEKEAKQLRKQGYHVVAGEIVEACTMPSWIRNRAERLAGWMEEPCRVEKADKMMLDDIWSGSELRSLARALGADRDDRVRDLFK